MRILSSGGCARCLALGITGAPPGDWAILSGDDSAWELVVDGSAVNGPAFPLASFGALWVGPTEYQVSLPDPGGQQWIMRLRFVVPPGPISAATLQIAPNDHIVAGFLNGVSLPGGSGTNDYFGIISYTLAGGDFHQQGDLFGGENILALQVTNRTGTIPGSTAIQLVLDIDVTAVAGWDSTTDGASVGSAGAYGANLSTATTGHPAVRVRHSSGVVCWEHDGDLYRVRSGDKTAMQVPFPVTTAPANVVLCRDPETGLPMWSESVATATADTGQAPLPSQTEPTPSSTVLTTQPVLPPPLVPEPVVDNCPLMRCGAALQMAIKLREQYDLIRGLLLFMLAAPFLVRFPLIGGETAFEWLMSQIIGWAVKNEVAPWAIAVLRALRYAVLKQALTSITTLEGIGDSDQTQLAKHAYAVLVCTQNSFTLTSAMLGNWEALINADTATWSEWQRHVLVYCVQFSPFSVYQQTAQSGAAHPSTSCGSW